MGRNPFMLPATASTTRFFTIACASLVASCTSPSKGAWNQSVNCQWCHSVVLSDTNEGTSFLQWEHNEQLRWAAKQHESTAEKVEVAKALEALLAKQGPGAVVRMVNEILGRSNTSGTFRCIIDEDWRHSKLGPAIPESVFSPIQSHMNRKEEINPGPVHAGEGVSGIALVFTSASEGLMQRDTTLWVTLIILGVEVVFLFPFEIFHKECTGEDAGTKPPQSNEHASSSQTVLRIFNGAWHLSQPYFTSPSGKKGWYCVLMLVCLTVLNSVNVLASARLMSLWVESFLHHDVHELHRAIILVLLTTLAGASLNAYKIYFMTLLTLFWREHMTQQFVGAWLDGHTYLFMKFQLPGVHQVDNPEQRIQEDVFYFINSLIVISCRMLDCIIRFFVFLPALLRLCPPRMLGLFYCPGWLLWWSIFWCTLSTFMYHQAAKPLITLTGERQREEATFRRTSAQMRQQAESIAMIDGVEWERNRANQCFHNVKIIMLWQMLYRRRYDFFVYFQQVFESFMPLFLLAPSVFLGDLPYAKFVELSRIVDNITDSLDVLPNLYEQIITWRACADRLLAFEHAVNAVKENAPSINVKHVPPDEKACMKFEAIFLPSGVQLWGGVDLSFAPGRHVMITGKEGCGKSMLFRAVAGVWPCVRDGQACLPARGTNGLGGTCFIPQKISLPHSCTLAEAVAYPESCSLYSRTQIQYVLKLVGLEKLLQENHNVPPKDGVEDRVSLTSYRADAETGCRITRVLSWCLCCNDTNKKDKSLDALCDDLDPLEHNDDWGNRLSPGMLQRLAIAHVILRQPLLLFMDEATSAVGKDSAVELYDLLTQSLPQRATIITITHDLEHLQHFHSVHLEVQGAGPDKRLQHKDPDGMQAKTCV